MEKLDIKTLIEIYNILIENKTNCKSSENSETEVINDLIENIYELSFRKTIKILTINEIGDCFGVSTNKIKDNIITDIVNTYIKKDLIQILKKLTKASLDVILAKLKIIQPETKNKKIIALFEVITLNIFNQLPIELNNKICEQMSITTKPNESIIEIICKTIMEQKTNEINEINNNNEIDKEDKKDKKPKDTISKSLRVSVWNSYIGEKIAEAKCYCCGNTSITKDNFQCGHVIARKMEGTTDLPNLRPICSPCNGSMGIKNMLEFVKDSGYTSSKMYEELCPSCVKKIAIIKNFKEQVNILNDKIKEINSILFNLTNVTNI